MQPPSMDRRLLRAAMSNMVLHNDRNDCFINAAVTATLWTFLSRSDFEPSFLGPQATLIAESVLGHADQPFTIVDQPWFSLEM